MTQENFLTVQINSSKKMIQCNYFVATAFLPETLFYFADSPKGGL